MEKTTAGKGAWGRGCWRKSTLIESHKTLSAVSLKFTSLTVWHWVHAGFVESTKKQGRMLKRNGGISVTSMIYKSNLKVEGHNTCITSMSLSTIAMTVFCRNKATGSFGTSCCASFSRSQLLVVSLLCSYGFPSSKPGIDLNAFPNNYIDKTPMR